MNAMTTMQETAPTVTIPDAAHAEKIAADAVRAYAFDVPLMSDIVAPIVVDNVARVSDATYALAASLPSGVGVTDTLIVKVVNAIMFRLALYREQRLADALYVERFRNDGRADAAATVARVAALWKTDVRIGSPTYASLVTTVSDVRRKRDDGVYPYIWQHPLLIKTGSCVTHRSPGDEDGCVVNGFRVSTQVKEETLYVVISCKERIEIVNLYGIGFVVCTS